MTRALLPLLTAALLSGCLGYTVGPVRPTRMAGVETIAVPSFKSNVMAPRVEVLAADSVIRQIQQDGTYRIGREETADVVLEGTVRAITRVPVRSLRRNVLATSEFSLLVTLDYKVTNRKTGALAMQGSQVGRTTFFVSEDLVQDERQALPLAFDDAAVGLVQRISEGF